MINLVILSFLLVSSVSLVVLLLYVIDRIRRIEDVAEALIRESPAAEKEKRAEGPFGGYQGKELWDIMSGRSADKLDGDTIEKEHQRYAALVEKAVKLTVEDGHRDGEAGNPKQNPKNERVVKTLRGTIKSWLPSREISTIYNTAYDSARSSSEDLARLEANFQDSVHSIFSQISIDVPDSLARLSHDSMESTAEQQNPDDKLPGPGTSGPDSMGSQNS
ncbi:MAG: hypothetical protein PsegKO_34210 [Pseudohongiellaceae bacterium]|jgi:hypothetical protein